MQLPKNRIANAITLCLHTLILAGCGSTSSLTARVEHPCAESAYIEFRNTGVDELRMEGWEIHDTGGNHTLPIRQIAPNATLRIWRGTGLDDAANVYLNQPISTWRNGEISSAERPPRLPWDSIHAFFLKCNPPGLGG